MATFVTDTRSSFSTKKQGKGLLRFGVIGYGYWGPNVVRNLDQLDGVGEGWGTDAR